MTDHEYELRVKQFQGAQFASTSATPGGQVAMRFGLPGETMERRWVSVSGDGKSFTLLHDREMAELPGYTPITNLTSITTYHINN